MSDRDRKLRLPAPRTTTAGGALPLDAAPVEPVYFDYDAVERGVRPTTGNSHTPSQMADGLRAAIEWMAIGEGDKNRGRLDRKAGRAALNRLLVMSWYLGLPCVQHFATITEFASSHGLTAEGLNKYVRALNRRFGVYAAGQKHSMRRKERTNHPSASDGLN